jgi:hypothetical protein
LRQRSEHEKLKETLSKALNSLRKGLAKKNKVYVYVAVLELGLCRCRREKAEIVVELGKFGRQSDVFTNRRSY